MSEFHVTQASLVLSFRQFGIIIWIVKAVVVVVVVAADTTFVAFVFILKRR